MPSDASNDPMEEPPRHRRRRKHCHVKADHKHDYTTKLMAEVERLQAENDRLRELVNGMRYCAHESYGMCARVPVGGERPFTCCPLYDFDAKEYRCEKLMQELGIEVDE